MSIFSKMKNAKKAADQHKDIKAQTAAPPEDKPKAAPYKHVPSHALQDALAGVPSAFREQDRELIKEHNKRRSMMTRNSSYMSTASAANSVHNLPRNVSRHSVDSFGTRLGSPPHGGSEVRLTPQNAPPVPRLATPNLDMNRSRLSRQGPAESYHNRQPVGKSPLASHDISPVGSSGNSTSSSSSRANPFSSPPASTPSTPNVSSSEALEIPAPLHGGQSFHPNPLAPKYMRNYSTEQFSTRPEADASKPGEITSRFLQPSVSYQPGVRSGPQQQQAVVAPVTDMPTAPSKKRKSVFGFGGKKSTAVAAY